MYDIVGDIHGYADKLVELLSVLGYKKTGDVWSHPTRTLISIGDLIDRGPQQKAVVDILKPMADEGHAIVLMGNHEFNAVSWAMKDATGEYLRPHTAKNYKQHKDFLQQADTESKWYDKTIEWFASLPLLFETPELRCVHAAWDKANINYLKQNLSKDFTLHSNQWHLANNPSHPLFDAIEYCLKGPEISLPNGQFFYDGGGVKRTEMRLQWWNVGKNSTYRDCAISVPDISSLPNLPIQVDYMASDSPAKPTFFGHYWMTGEPKLLSEFTTCLDWSVTTPDGVLAAYRFDGEEKLQQHKLTWA